MKTKRHSKIVELINSYDIETQEELAQKLEEGGFVVTQATVSRDIRDLKLSKVVTANGKQKYSLMPKQDGISEKYVRILGEAFVSMDMAQNILVVKTVSGMAMAAAAALDSMQMSEIVGCIAGDDTIMAAIRSVDDTVVVMERIRKLVYKNE
ncbi:arginine repressor [Lachnoanaerobaculum sp. MSX33]|jgi:arginine repressor|uniref:arginine repressor n=1 Tax=Lachnoanaerobaculum TaxID=1164882 RepID=UPI00027A5B56|nr:MULTISPECIES: arginine repressor [unclassified Lachnoanaerobaculum]MDU6629564.1 arginine repressor [Lachnoanaerobaculum sp.]EJP18549.1 arginine repressor [Lachnoanaerobaculum sp. ICM7]EJZ70247.1 arginine repressor [Lachnoanaerobaculum sp. OBRC5-5]ETO97168.1 arginine repressor [Lachnoanaerobaculum sp. MSX33]GMO02040.1 arginine repressor [Lachnoanaerobaculum sp. JCM 36186]